MTSISLSAASPVPLEADPAERWVTVFRTGILPQLTRADLLELADALRRDDSRIITGETVRPGWRPDEFDDTPATAGDPIAFVAMARGVRPVRLVEEFWSRTVYEADALLGEPAACRWLLNWIDTVDRAGMVAGLLAEVERALEAKE